MSLPGPAEPPTTNRSPLSLVGGMRAPSGAAPPRFNLQAALHPEMNEFVNLNPVSFMPGMEKFPHIGLYTGVRKELSVAVRLK